jgi:predicted metal-dependent TIM-barrel fold hydrolase
MKFNQKEVKVLAHKYFINQLLINNCKNILNVVLTPYSRKLIGLPNIINVIKNGVRGIDRLNKESFDL